MGSRTFFLILFVLAGKSFTQQQDYSRSVNWPTWYRQRITRKFTDNPIFEDRKSVPPLWTTRVNHAFLQRISSNDQQQQWDQDVLPPSTYTKHHPGRRVCTKQHDQNFHHRHQTPRHIRLIFTELTSAFACCPGWTQVTHLSFGCNKPTCLPPCQNNGMCISPGKCTCTKGYTGSQCQTDVDECATEKPCGQICRNIPGSYECHCRSGFHLQQDGQSCQKNDSDGTAFEARDLENDFHEELTTTTLNSVPISDDDTGNEVDVGNFVQNYQVLLKRLVTLEKQIAKGKKRETETNSMGTKLTLAVENIKEMKNTIENLQFMQQEIYDLKNKLKLYEQETRRIQHLTNRVIDVENKLRLHCRNIMPFNNGLLNI
ncbi:uncharacterized protein slow isoform X2 [Prorops nasuta]|uniref:uncharacterized protein slow isoform X2 n=1 Tax=Prorops nasuta TaxID=863751 RepID=UPI0034CED7A2